MRVAALILVLSMTVGLTSAQLNATCFQNDGSVFITPQDGNYNNDRLIFNEKIQRRPVAIAYAYTEQQVQDLILCAQQSELQSVARSGGHGYEGCKPLVCPDIEDTNDTSASNTGSSFPNKAHGYAVQDQGITVDVSNLTSFAVDNTANTVTFGPGLRLGQLYLRMYLEANSLFPAGTCPWVGTAGHILGGGSGQNVRTYGLACDQLVSLNMVDSSGKIITATKTSNPDLFWASCGGGGGNLGIVTSFTVKMNPLSSLPKVTTMQLSASYDNAVALFDAVQKWAPTADKKLNLQILIGFGSANVGIQWNGPQAEAEAALQSSGLLSVPGIQTTEVTETSWINATLLWANNAQSIGDASIYDLNMTNGLPANQGRSFQAASSYNQELMSIEGIQTMVNAVTSLGPGSTAYVEHKMLGGAVSEVAPTDTAFFYRTALFESQYFYYWTGGDEEGAATQWLTSTTEAMKPYVGQGAYINYPDPILAAKSSWPEAYYGGNLQRYIAVKTEYDPTNYFHNPLTVQPDSSAAGSINGQTNRTNLGPAAPPSQQLPTLSRRMGGPASAPAIPGQQPYVTVSG